MLVVVKWISQKATLLWLAVTQQAVSEQTLSWLSADRETLRTPSAIARFPNTEIFHKLSFHFCCFILIILSYFAERVKGRYRDLLKPLELSTGGVNVEVLSVQFQTERPHPRAPHCCAQSPLTYSLQADGSDGPNDAADLYGNTCV